MPWGWHNSWLTDRPNMLCSINSTPHSDSQLSQPVVFFKNLFWVLATKTVLVVSPDRGEYMWVGMPRQICVTRFCNCPGLVTFNFWNFVTKKAKLPKKMDAFFTFFGWLSERSNCESHEVALCVNWNQWGTGKDQFLEVLAKRRNFYIGTADFLNHISLQLLCCNGVHLF